MGTVPSFRPELLLFLVRYFSALPALVTESPNGKYNLLCPSIISFVYDIFFLAFVSPMTVSISSLVSWLSQVALQLMETYFHIINCIVIKNDEKSNLV